MSENLIPNTDDSNIPDGTDMPETVPADAPAETPDAPVDEPDDDSDA